MRKEILAEKFMNASSEYCSLQNAMMDAFEEDPIMSCLIGSLNKLADDYYRAMLDIYLNGYTVDEITRTDRKEE